MKKIKIIIIGCLITALIMATGCTEEDGNGNSKTTPAIAMTWDEDPEGSGDYIGYAVGMSGTECPMLSEVNVVYTQGTESDSKLLSQIESGNLTVGSMTMTFTDVDDNGEFGPVDHFSLTGVEEGDMVKLVYEPTGQPMFSQTF